jgi:hypothetical protein
VFVAGEAGVFSPHQPGPWSAFVAHHDLNGDQLWRFMLGTQSADVAYAAALDGAGGVFITGTTQGSLAAMNAGEHDIFVARISGPLCYPNCDGSTTQPVLNVADFACFLQRFAAGDPYANCDGSTVEPVLNVADFSCFLAAFAGGCE